LINRSILFSKICLLWISIGFIISEEDKAYDGIKPPTGNLWFGLIPGTSVTPGTYDPSIF